MIYNCDNEKIDVTSKEFNLLKNVDYENTCEGRSYKKNNFVYKIYYNEDEYSYEEIGETLLDEQSCVKLTTIKNLKHFFLPVGVIYDENNKYAGCKAVFIKPLAPDEKRIIEKPVTTFLDEIYEVQKDLDILTENKVLVGDFGIHNMIDNGHINIFDAGGYEVDFDGKYSKQRIKNNQYNQLDILLTEILDYEIKRICTRPFYSFVGSIMFIRDLSNSMGVLKMLEKEAIHYNSIEEFTEDVCKTKLKKR